MQTAIVILSFNLFVLGCVCIAEAVERTKLTKRVAKLEKKLHEKETGRSYQEG